MNLHEHQAKELLKGCGVPVLEGRVAYSPDEAATAFSELRTNLAVIKAQVHAGGRGKGKAVRPKELDPNAYDVKSGMYAGPGIASDRGVVLCHSGREAREAAGKLLGHLLVTKQTGAGGRLVRRVYVESGAQIDRELYAAVLIDRKAALPILMVSPEGGVDIEEVASRTPEKILKLHFDPSVGLWPHQARRAAWFLGLSGDTFKSALATLTKLCEAFVRLDAQLLEINPLGVCGGRLLCLDAKLSFDDNALYRQARAEELRDPNEDNERETAARSHDLSYVALDGTIGCLVNGAGLAMATMDLIKHHGGAPANFLDVGGGATTEKVTAGFQIILQDPHVNAILVNIFGGIMRCDVIAEGVIAAARQTGLKVPLVVRLEGNRVNEGRRLLKESGLALIAADSLSDAAQKAVLASRRSA
jgi:succinyl-CoA synthetase beta subunit